MEDKQVLIKSNTMSTVGITKRELGVNKTWDRYGVVRSISLEVLKELMYENGVAQLFTDGYLTIEDMEVKKELGLEPEDAKEPVNTAVLSATQKENLLKNKPFVEFKSVLEDLSYNQLLEIAEFAIEKEIMISYDKNGYLLERVSKNVLECIKNKQLAKEA